MCSYTSKGGGRVAFREAEERRDWLVMSHLCYLHTYIIYTTTNNPSNSWSCTGYSVSRVFFSFVQNACRCWLAIYNLNALTSLKSVYNSVLISFSDFLYSLLVFIPLLISWYFHAVQFFSSKKIPSLFASLIKPHSPRSFSSCLMIFFSFSPVLIKLWTL